ncbi:hypothetical protein [Salinigranum sp.]|uniref:hypothetical protein n=1 Tax=Salinigranum sp. TaxID=1966351 RepID=UPI00356B383B
MADSIECPECGATMDSLDQMETEEITEIEEKPRGGIGYGQATQDLYLCRKCRKPLGVGRRGNE